MKSLLGLALVFVCLSVSLAQDNTPLPAKKPQEAALPAKKVEEAPAPAKKPEVLRDATVPAVVAEINAYRASRGLMPLMNDPQLEKAAQRQAADMSSHNRMNHTGSDGSNFAQRARDAGFSMTSGGEIIAESGDPKEAVSMWSQSPGHNAQMLTREWSYVGTAVSGNYACAVFGSRAGGSVQSSDSSPSSATPPNAVQPNSSQERRFRLFRRNR